MLANLAVFEGIARKPNPGAWQDIIINDTLCL
jgi:hypothetical protein